MTLRRIHANSVRNVLDGSISDTDTSLDLADASDFPTPGTNEEVRIKIESEILSYTSKSSNTLSGLSRGLEGTAAASHADQVLVSLNATADSYDRKKDLETVETGITASTTQTQGQGALTAEINVVDTCANANDTVTAPAIYSDYPQTLIIKNDGAETLQVFPASGDDLGAGVNTAVTIASGEYKSWQSYDDTTWIELTGGSGGGGGAVDSVNSQTGVVVLDADDIDDTSTTNKFTTAADISKLAGIESNATADQSDAEIKTAYENNANTNAFTDAEQTKLSNIEANADVTDETNVKAALDGMTTTQVTPESSDKILLLDDSDSDNIKHALFSAFSGGGGGGGKILQVQSVSKTDTFSTTSSSFIDITGLSVSITPSSSSSTILILAALAVSNNTNDASVFVRAMRDSTPILVGTSVGSRTACTGHMRLSLSSNHDKMIYFMAFGGVDSPATTSSTTYKLQMSVDNSTTGYVNRTADDANNLNRPRTSSSIILLEIDGT